MISNALQFLHNFWKFKIKKLESLKMKYNKWIVEIDKEVCISNFIWERESTLQNTFLVTICSFHVIFFSFVWNDMLDMDGYMNLLTPKINGRVDIKLHFLKLWIIWKTSEEFLKFHSKARKCLQTNLITMKEFVNSRTNNLAQHNFQLTVFAIFFVDFTERLHFTKCDVMRCDVL